MRIFSIETSCDETSVALVDATKAGFVIRKHVVSSQIETHKQYGGVVPEVAARMHLETLQPLIDRAIGMKLLQSADIIAVTAGPGLITSLMVGVQTAKTLAYLFKKPLLGVNHLEGHIYASWLTEPELSRHPKKYFPALVLIVSGGHTELVLMKGQGKYVLLGQTLDDAAGEAFDKVAKILNLGYPGGPVISQLASRGNPRAIDFPRPMAHAKGYDMSFSGLKTSVLYYLQKQKKISTKAIPDIAASFQQAAIDVLMTKVTRAQKEYKPRSLMLAGGVSANKALRKSFTNLGEKTKTHVVMPALEFTGDNAAMIAAAAYFHRNEASTTLWQTLRFDPHLPFIV